MKIICKMATQVPGFGIVKKGQPIEWPDGVKMPPQVVANFKDVDGKALVDDGKGEKATTDAKSDAEALVKKTANVGKTKLMAMLEGAHVAFSDKSTATELARSWLRHKGEIAD